MASPGQPTSYKPEYRELAHNYCLLGATNEALAGDGPWPLAVTASS